MTPDQSPRARATPETSGHAESQYFASSNTFPWDKPSRPHWQTKAVCLFLAVLVWVVFGQTVHYEFVNFDDPSYIYNNPVITQGLNWQGIIWVFTHNNAGTWFPLTDISHQLDWQLYSSQAGGHHLTNVIMHALAAIFLFLALQKLTQLFWCPAFVAAVFAIHPLRAESVAWAVERKDVLSGLFFMLTLWAWARFVEKRPPGENPEKNSDRAFSPHNPTRWTFDYWLTLFFFILGLLSKSMLVTLPFALLLLDYWPLKRLPSGNDSIPRLWFRAWLGLIWEKVPFLLLSAVICVVTFATQKNAVVVAQSHDFRWRIGNALQAYVDYLGHIFYPVGLTVAYSHTDTDPTLWRAILSGLILLAISAGAIVGWRKYPWLIVGWFWYLGLLLPVIDIMQAAHNARADRYTYLPQIGLTIMLAWGAMRLCAFYSHRRVMLGFTAAVMVAALSVSAYIQTSHWKNSVTLWTRALACTKDNSFAYNTLGSAVASEGKWDEAARNFQRALQIEPDYPEAEANLGVALAAQGKTTEAIQHFERALQLNPYSSEAHYNLGDALAKQGKAEEAIRHFEQALQNRPDYTAAHYDWGLTLAGQGKWNEAIPHYEQALHLKLDPADARYITGVALATHQKWDEAIKLYYEALQLKPDYAEAHRNLGIALENQGKSAEAISHLQKALELAIAQGNTSLADTIRVLLKTYHPSLTKPPTP